MVSHIIWNAIFRSNYDIPEIALSGRVALWVHFLYTFIVHIVYTFGALSGTLSGVLSGTVFIHFVLSMGKNTSIDGAL
jgi:hypothetical protein